ncbi:MAG: hypothetical protein RML35_06785 [Chloroherpetonaceae bacterium]|nr:hypothetical protein [Chloroherpetonaceae bacterium]
MHFLRNLEGKNVMCAGSSQYIIQIAQKRTLIGGVAGVLNLDERKDDILSFFNATSDEVRRKILKKYKIDYVYIGEAEKQLIQLDRNFLVEYPLVYGNSVAEIHVARQEKTEIQE